MLRSALLIPPLLALAACGGGERFAFASEKERQCFLEAEAAIDTPNTQLERGRAGGFVEVTRVDGLVRDVDASETFRQCMAVPDAAISPVVAEAPPITFTAEEQAIWSRLSDAEKRAALIFIQQGGTLRGYLDS